ncbi:MAG: succinyl-CoA--3-ketoacid-CoA transferase [Rhodocyclales bacterium RIFCSPLOWO2_02_FULL_63_24]|nr:MAG: succinyl-CoA--3-ketoacid-CoA transferase [Rhodocyclales bacterium RIFCSPLOWO2_02_FULL_63_24]
MDAREFIARRIAQEFRCGMVVNLGIGIPTASANHVPHGVDVILQSENGCLGLGPRPSRAAADPDLANAGGEPITLLPGAATFDLATSFCIIRGGHVDATVLGALEVDSQGNIANWKIPGKRVPGMGGGMDLLAGARKVIVALQHADKDGDSKIRKHCRLPLSAVGVVDLIVTDKAVIEVTAEGLVLREIAPELTVADVVAATDADLILPATVATIHV